MDKNVVIAQVLYYMAVHDKTQPSHLLTPRYRRELSERLKMYQSLLSWLKSNSSLEKGQTLSLLHYIENHSEIFPVIPTTTFVELQKDNYIIEQHVTMCDEWNTLISKMEEIIRVIGKWLSYPWALRNDKWIMGFLAFHNFPRPFLDCDHIGLWNGCISPISAAAAVQAAQFYPIA